MVFLGRLGCVSSAWLAEDHRCAIACLHNVGASHCFLTPVPCWLLVWACPAVLPPMLAALPMLAICPQVYSLAFHQTMLECTAHAADKGLLLLALWRGFAMLWDAALQVCGEKRADCSLCQAHCRGSGPPLHSTL